MSDMTARPSGHLWFLALKGVNLALLIAYSFGMVFVLVRSVPPGFYPWMVMLSSIGGYVLAVDLGFSNYVYSVVRRRFLTDALTGAEELVAEATSLYLAIAALACAIAAPVVFTLAPAGLRLAMFGYFASIVLPLPWMLIRRTAAAVDLHFQIEALECIRRAVFCGFGAAMLFGLPLIGFVGLSLAGWVVAMAAAWLLLRRHGFHVRPGRFGRMLAFLGENRDGVMKSGKFTALEFAIYNFPYLAIPFLFHGPANLVGFDLFNKVARFGGAAYSVPAEAFTPQQTRAYYAGDVEGVKRYQRMTWAVGAVPMVIGSVLLISLGGPVFDALLAGIHAIPLVLRCAMAAMLAALLLQSSAGGFLLSVGHYDEVSRVATVTACLMLGVVVATALFGLSFVDFMVLYVLAYGVHAVLFEASFRRLSGRARHGMEALA
ncbi:hypothetical protein [Sphingomonas desiccabilis]|uniref:Lipopolysaccharide biosynthesis protein n=1 Tax=Sphingomonas desiccabilis TaxID=429134 RepID=A0A4Q2ISK8_9SPHN|nr:hypothetical protein [Sphingomonas desiccabilis]MBB3911817.1 hypothetical protein [Sphingomonas desiccabilis]RXZ31467.1 hypothetical protein EO081_09470 [Sphingomonas desiccabilis]